MEAIKPQVYAEAQVNQHNEKDDAALKAKKAESAKAWKAKRDAEEQQKAQTAQELIKYLADKKIDLPEKYSKLLNDFAFKKKATSTVGNVFTKLFGENPKVGDSVDLFECYKRTYKSVSEIKRLCRDWEKKGIEVEFVQDADVAKSKFILKKMQSAGCILSTIRIIKSFQYINQEDLILQKEKANENK